MHFRRHRCPHKQENNELFKELDESSTSRIISSQHDDYKAYEPKQVRELRPQPYRAVTELGLSEGTVESVTSYKAEYNEKKVERQSRQVKITL